MSISTRFLVKGTAWTVGAYGLSLVLRLVTNVVMARLLAPELFGIMLIVYSMRSGIELVSDVGISQNIIYNKNANDPDFYNTAWSLGLLRSIVLWLVFVAAAFPAAQFYQAPILSLVLPITAFGVVFGGLTSISRQLIQKRLQIAKVSLFDLATGLLSSVAHILLAYFMRTIWALVFGGLFASAALMVGSYFLLPDVKQRFFLSKQYVFQILHFGKWIFAASLVYFLATNFDRLYLAKVIPLQLLGIYGIARAISELAIGLVLGLGNNVLFPFIASHSKTSRDVLYRHLGPIRFKFLLLAALGCSILIATADIAVKLLYDERYHAATWILPILFIGSWFSVLASINESTLLGLGKPFYSAISNVTKLAFLVIALPLSINANGIVNGVIIVALADVCRYIPILVGQWRERFSFGSQDMLVTSTMFALVGIWEFLRWVCGLGTSFDSLATNMGFS